MKRRIRLRFVAVAVIVLGLAAWGLSAGPFGRGIVVGALVALGSLVGFVFILSRTAARRLGGSLEPPPLPTGAWDYAMQAQDIGGQPVDFSRFRGRVLVLNFWATWCGPCVAEMPSLGSLVEKTADLDVQVALVSREEKDVVTRFMEKRGFNLPVYLLDGEPPECFKSRAIPATFVLDKTGMIALRHFGSARWDADSVVAFVRGLAATPVG